MNANPPAQQTPIAQGIASLGRGNDSMLVHMTPGEVQGLQKLAMAHGGSLTINPHTGLPEAGFLSALLPMIAGAALAPFTGGLSAALLIGGGYTAATGSLKKGIMAGLGAYGGAGLGEGLAAAGATTPAATVSANTLPTGISAAQTTAGVAPEFSLAQPSQLGMQNLSGSGIVNEGLKAGMSPTAFANSASSLGASAPVSSGLGALNEYGIPMSAQMPGTVSLTPLSSSVAGIEPPVPTPTPNVNPNDVKPFGYNPNPAATPPVEAPSAAKLAPQSVYSQVSAPTPPATPSSLSNMGQGLGNLTSSDSATRTAAQKAFGTKAGVSTAMMAAAPVLTQTPTLKGGIGASPAEYYNTAYSPGERNPNFGKPGEPYFINQGYSGGSYDKTAKIAGGGSIGSEPEDEGGVIPQSKTAEFGGYDDPYKDMSGKSLEYALRSRNPHTRSLAQVEAKRRGISDQTMSAAAGGSIRGYDEGGDVRPQGGIAALAQQPRQSPFQIQRSNVDPNQLNQYMAGLNASFQGAPMPQYSAPSYTQTGNTASSQGNASGGNGPISSWLASLPLGDTASTPTYSYTPPKPVTSVASMGGDLSGMVNPNPTVPSGSGTPTYTYDPRTQKYTDITPPPPPAPEAPAYNGSPIQTDEDGRQFVMVQGDEGLRRDYRMGQEGGPDQSGGDKAGGSIESHYAMGGIAAIPTYAAGGKLLNGDGDGMSDSIPAVINGPKPQRAALADGEFVIPADVVSHLGNGSTKAGAKKLYQMLDRVRVARVGNKQQGKQINPNKFMPV